MRKRPAAATESPDPPSLFAPAPPAPPRPARKWTDAQRAGITTVGHSLLVSAAAGSGKTSVLAERCAHLVCDCDDPCDVDQLLVVTFTEAAAAEMKGRIRAALRDRAAREPSGRLAHQLALMEHAHVSTLHSFCSRVLRQHFHLVGIDPTFSVLDGDEAKLLRNETARQLLADRFELDDAEGSFAAFIDAYGDGDDARVVQLIVRSHEMLASLRDPEAWMRDSLARIEDAAAPSKPLEKTALGLELAAFIGSGLASLRTRCDEAIAVVSRAAGFPKYEQQLREYAATLAHWERLLESAGLAAVSEEVRTFQPPKLPSVRNDVPGKDVAKAAIEAVRDGMTKGPWVGAMRFTPAEYREGMRSVLPHARLFLDLVRQFGTRYRMAKDASRTIDFSDLERLTLHALADKDRPDGVHPSRAAHAYHRRFRHVLVDEYQDINEVQDAILSLLSTECLWAKDERGRRKDDEGGTRPASSFIRPPSALASNLFAVGDVKQSIYRFRLAEPARFLARQLLFRDDDSTPRRGQLIALQANFRSRAKLLEAINATFERLMTEAAADIEYDASHRLVPGLPYVDPPAGVRSFPGAPIGLHLLPDKFGGSGATGGDAEDVVGDDDASPDDLDRTQREAVLVAARVRQMMGLDGGQPVHVADKDDAGTPVYRPVRYRDVVILLRAMQHKAEDFADALRGAGIPVHSEGRTGFFESTEVRDVIALLRLLDNARQDVPLATFLRSPLGRLPRPGAEDALARIRLACPERAAAYHEAVVRYAAEQDDELAAHLRDLLADLKRWRELAQRRPLADLLAAVFEETGYLAYVGALHGGEQRVANLQDLQARAAQFGTFHRQGLSRFLEFLDTLKEETDLGQPSVASEAQDVVRVMSVHRSKGLEYPVVIVPDLGKGINLGDCNGPVLLDRMAGLGMSVIDTRLQARYPSLASTLVGRRLRQQALAEELRVLYVAMTRAKEHLILIGTCPAKRPDEWRSRWTGHAGPLPAADVLGAGCMLDWLGPVAAATGPAAFDVVAHDPDAVRQWRGPRPTYERWTERQAALARLEPISPAPPPDDVARRVIGRLTAPYPFEPFTRVAASRAATRDETHAPPAASASASGSAAALPLPRFLAGDCGPSAADKGTATHLLLEHLDYAAPLDEDGIRGQLGGLVDRELLTEAQASCVDVASIVWLAGSEAGAMLRDAKRTRREVPVYLADAPEGPGVPPSDDPLDQVMIRGRLDALVIDDSSVTIIDYKTDAVSEAQVPARAEAYRAQLATYARAVERITGKPVKAALLAFLTPRVVWTLRLPLPGTPGRG
jgi:ATP-dependent helicase/nuclease subunit A